MKETTKIKLLRESIMAAWEGAEIPSSFEMERSFDTARVHPVNTKVFGLVYNKKFSEIEFNDKVIICNFELLYFQEKVFQFTKTTITNTTFQQKLDTLAVAQKNQIIGLTDHDSCAYFLKGVNLILKY